MGSPETYTHVISMPESHLFLAAKCFIYLFLLVFYFLFPKLLLFSIYSYDCFYYSFIL